MAHLLILNCPQCRKRLTYVPLDGLTLHFRCEEHGLVILKPLVVASCDDQFESASPRPADRPRSAHDAA